MEGMFNRHEGSDTYKVRLCSLTGRLSYRWNCIVKLCEQLTEFDSQFISGPS
jgi:hypothetical protein